MTRLEDEKKLAQIMHKNEVQKSTSLPKLKSNYGPISLTLSMIFVHLYKSYLNNMIY